MSSGKSLFWRLVWIGAFYKQEPLLPVNKELLSESSEEGRPTTIAPVYKSTGLHRLGVGGRGTGDGERGTGNRRRGTGNGEQEMGHDGDDRLKRGRFWVGTRVRIDTSQSRLLGTICKRNMC